MEPTGLLSLNLQQPCFHFERRPIREGKSERVIALRGLSQGFLFAVVYHYPLAVISKEFYIEMLFFLPLSLGQQHMKSFEERRAPSVRRLAWFVIERNEK